jgi:hypothetical protein
MKSDEKNPFNENEGGEVGGDDDSGDDSFNSDELDGMLENMDIDKDFNMWSSFRSSISVRKVSDRSQELEEVPEDRQEVQDLETWRQRLARSEVFSHRYRPDAAEVQELKELETLLGMNTNMSSHLIMPKLTGLFRSSSGGETAGADGGKKGGGGKRKEVSPQDLALWNQLVQTSIDPQSSPSSNCLPASIILKRGPALMMSGNDNYHQTEENASECEVILLTHGLIVATVRSPATSTKSVGRETSSGSGRSQKLVPRSFERAVLWKHVETVAASSSSSSNLAWEIQLDKREGQGQRLVFVCASPRQRQAWLNAMEQVVVEYHSHSSSKKTASSKTMTSEFGWQYRYIVKPEFTTAVTDQTEYLDAITNGDNNIDWNQLDQYHGYTALHYAVRANHVSAMHSLLEAGANPNAPDQDDRTPMYYAVMDQLPQSTVALLKQYGGTPSEKATEQQSGELFGRVAATQAGIDEERNNRETAERVKAEQAAAAMSENMRLLQQRGEQIDELDGKARQLNEGAQNFGDMAKQLKEASKKKKWYQL